MNLLKIAADVAVSAVGIAALGLVAPAVAHADLFNRAHLDMRKSIVLYDEAGVFEVVLGVMPNACLLQRIYEETNVRYWSKCIV
jgi:hypothetical protein